MRSGERWGYLGWLAMGSPLIVLIGIAVVALVASTSPREVADQLAEPGTRQAIVISLRTTLVATALVAVFGTCVAMAVARAKGPLASLLETLVTIPAILPPSVAGLALLLAFGRSGMFGEYLDSIGISIAFSATAVVLAQVLVASPFFVREAIGAFRSIEPDIIDAGRLDGAGPFALGRRIVAPLAAPFLATGLILAWTRALGEFGATILFAGNLAGVTQTMPLAIYLGFESDLEQAKALAVILLVVAVAVLAIVRIPLRRQLVFAH